MSLTGATNAAVSAMKSQSAALSTISYNLANVSTTGFKASTSDFSSLLSSDGTDSDATGGVTVASKSNISAEGLQVSSESASDLAIDGSGFFVVSDGIDSTSTYYTRDGSFTVNSDGYLENDGYYLLGWPTDTDGNVIGASRASNLEAIDTDEISNYAAASTELTLTGNLPANATTGDSYSTDNVEVYDSLGTSILTTATWTKTGDNTWEVSFSGTTSGSDGSSTSPITVEFNEDGSLKSVSSTSITIAGSSGASDVDLTVDFGTIGASDGITQLTDSSTTISSTVSADSDGVEYGTLTDISIDDDGTVYAKYSNEATIAIYKIPIATFANAEGLEELSGSIYAATNDSAAAVLHLADTDGVGSITAYALESSTTNTSTEFSNMIAAQQAYSAAAQVITASKDMFDTLISAIR